jgi:hypothetical protein
MVNQAPIPLQAPAREKRKKYKKDERDEARFGTE